MGSSTYPAPFSRPPDAGGTWNCPDIRFEASVLSAEPYFKAVVHKMAIPVR
jgi:hypothetical protein